MPVSHDELVERFAHHPPKTPARVDLHERVRANAGQFAIWLNDFLPESREKSLALTALQETAMWANAAVAIHGDEGLPLPQTG